MTRAASNILIFGYLLTLSACSSAPSAPEPVKVIPQPTKTTVTQKATKAKVVAPAKPTTQTAIKTKSKITTKKANEKNIKKTKLAPTKKATPQNKNNITTTTKNTRPAKLTKQPIKVKAVTPTAARPKTKPKTPPTKSIAKALPVQPKETQPSAQANVQKIVVALESLPITIGHWTLDHSTAIANQCSLKSSTNSMDDGQGTTTVYIEITQRDTTIYTKSNIDISYTGTGFFFGDSINIPIEAIYTPTSTRFTKDHNNIATHLASYDEVEIKLGFWPSWPVTHPYSARFATGNFSSAHQALLECNKLQ